MGCFSWVKLESRKEMCEGQQFKFLIPKEFGGGHIVSTYDDYGRFDHLGKTYDIYEILAFWNIPEAVRGEATLFGAAAIDSFDIGANSNYNRCMAIDIACYEQDAAKLKYPLRITDEDDLSTYEDYDGMFSISAPDQGWNPTTVYDEARFEIASYDDPSNMPMWRDEHDEEDEI